MGQPTEQRSFERYQLSDIKGYWRTYQSFTLLDIFFSEQKLPIEVGEIDGIEIEN